MSALPQTIPSACGWASYSQMCQHEASPKATSDEDGFGEEKPGETIATSEPKNGLSEIEVASIGQQDLDSSETIDHECGLIAAPSWSFSQGPPRIFIVTDSVDLSSVQGHQRNHWHPKSNQGCPRHIYGKRCQHSPKKGQSIQKTKNVGKRFECAQDDSQPCDRSKENSLEKSAINTECS